MQTLFIAFRTAMFMTGFVVLWAWLALGVRIYDRHFDLSLPDWTPTLAIIFIVMGGALVMACGGVFTARGRGTPAPFDAPRVFVATGPYKWVRNPMYIGGAMLLAGLGLIERSISILFFTAGWLLLAHLLVIVYEEPTLQRRFGTTYTHYCARVQRWIPRFLIQS